MMTSDKFSESTLPKSRASRNLPKEYWDHILSDYDNSGLSQLAFCKGRKILYHRFQYYRQKLLQSKKQSPARVVPIEITKPADQPIVSTEAFALEIGNVKLSIPQSFDAAALKALLDIVQISSC